MTGGPRSRRILLELAAVVAIALAVAAVFYSNWIGECCGALVDRLFVLLLPGMFVAVVIGGGVHSATRVHGVIGIVVQFVALWAIVRLLMKAIRRRHPQ